MKHPEEAHRDPAGEAELLAWLLDRPGRAEGPFGEIEPSAQDARRLAELERFIARCRAAGAEQEQLSPRRQRALLARVLARSTREDLSWRGDLRLFRGFVLQRLRNSPALRIAAASLLVHLFALPLLAWYGLARFEADDAPVIRFAPLLPDAAFEEISEEAPEVSPGSGLMPELEPELELGLDPPDPAFYVANSIAWARYRLLEPLPAPPSPRADESRAAELLRERWRVLAGGVREARPELAPGPDAGLAERALWSELLLDLALVQPVGTSRPPAALAEALAALGRARLPADAGGLLGAAALARAESQGLLPRAAADALGQARLDLADSEAAALLLRARGDLRRVAPLDATWCAALLAAREGLELGSDWALVLARR